MKIPREMEIYRRDHPLYPGERGDHTCGWFQVPARGLAICAASGDGWDHVSVSRQDRCPTWDEMQWVREKFFKPEETCMQVHPPLDQHINHMPYCLHLWRPHNHEIPLPPKGMIA